MLIRHKTSDLVEPKVKTTPELVNKANQLLFAAKVNLPHAAKMCGMTEKEMKMTFYEYVKHNPPTYQKEDYEN